MIGKSRMLFTWALLGLRTSILLDILLMQSLGDLACICHGNSARMGFGEGMDGYSGAMQCDLRNLNLHICI